MFFKVYEHYATKTQRYTTLYQTSTKDCFKRNIYSFTWESEISIKCENQSESNSLMLKRVRDNNRKMDNRNKGKKEIMKKLKKRRTKEVIWENRK